MSNRYSRNAASPNGGEKADILIGEIKELNSNFAWLRDYVEDMEIGEAIGEIADNTDALKQIFLHVGKLEGGMGIVNSLIQGIRNHAKEGEKK